MAKDTFRLVSTDAVKALDLSSYGLGTTDVSTFDPAGIAYAIEYGVRKSLQDSVSGVRKDIMSADAKAWAEYVKESAFPSDEPTDANRKAVADIVIHTRMSARLVAMVAGDVGHTVRGPRVVGVDRIMRDVAEEMIRAAATAKAKPMPKGDNLKALIDGLIAKDANKGSPIRTEAQRRFALTAVADDIDLS